MKKMILLLLILSPYTYTMQPHHLEVPKPHRSHQLHAQRRSSQLPMDIIQRPSTPCPDRIQTPHTPITTYRTIRTEQTGPIVLPDPIALSAARHESIIDVQHLSPEVVHVEEVRAHAVEVQAISKKKIACLVAASAITSSILTAAVTLTIHFTECQK